MNEFGILMKLLTRTGNPIGASMEDMLEALGLPEDVGRHSVYKKLATLNEMLKPLGLIIQHNPLNHVYYVDTNVQMQIIPEESGLPDRLAATLLVVITLTYQEGGWVSFTRIREFRRKRMEGVRADLRELQNLGYIEIDRGAAKARPGPRVPFEIDYETFFSKLSEEPSSE